MEPAGRDAPMNKRSSILTKTAYPLPVKKAALIQTLSLLNKRWIWLFTLGYGVFVGLPYLAPVFMHLGWVSLGRATYFVYGFLCHQLPQRSFFLFGPKAMYSLAEVQTAWQHTFDPFLLRGFVGNIGMGWKVAWSDRMVSMYTSVLLFTWLWYPIRRKLRPVPFWGFLLLLVPMAVDGGTHLISDTAGLGQGFRDTNLWLAQITGNFFPETFYAGEAFGSFNSWMRLLTGLFFGLAIVWFVFPHYRKAYNVSKFSPRLQER